MPQLLCLIGLHHRSRKDRFRDRDGLMKSHCQRCGMRMVREEGGGRWLSYGGRDTREKLAPLRALLDQLTGPVIFLMLLALALGITLWLRGDRTPDRKAIKPAPVRLAANPAAPTLPPARPRP